jgi:uncharacterized repeat protein (TIGR01451 family)
METVINKVSQLQMHFSIWTSIIWCGLCTYSTTAQTPFVCQDQFFLTFVQPPTSLNEVTINDQGNVDFITINGNIGLSLNAAGYRSTDNFIYCLSPGTRELVRLDRNGSAEILANLPLSIFLNYYGGDITPDGRYLILIGTSQPNNAPSVSVELVRVDLTSPTYDIQTIGLNGNALIFDIAFNPITGVLYGYDSNGSRLVRVDPNNGNVSTPFQAQVAPSVTGSLFFDAFGNLFAYGSQGPFSESQNSLYQIDTQTGRATFLTSGAAVEASDGCSCPYTIQLLKTVEPRVSFPCDEVEYTFTIANTTGRSQENLVLNDRLPDEFTFVSVSSNPLGGTLASQAGDNFFRLTNLSVPVGEHRISILVNTGSGGSGFFRNQATLSNLPTELGTIRRSDDPSTLVKGDSTTLEIRTLPADFLDIDTTLCLGRNSVLINAARFAPGIPGSALRYLWQDGSTNSTLEVFEEGTYQALVQLGCDSLILNFNVKEAGIEVNLAIDQFEIRLGDSLLAQATAQLFNSEEAFFSWNDPQPGSVRCLDCPETWIRPFNDLTYTVQAMNEYGCWDTASLKVKVIKNYNVYFPNVISIHEGIENPNNAVFFASGDATTRIERLSIFSRWGEMMFDTRNIDVNSPTLGWDGMFNGQLVQPGVYVWQATIAYLDGVKTFFSGDLTVIR